MAEEGVHVGELVLERGGLQSRLELLEVLEALWREIFLDRVSRLESASERMTLGGCAWRRR